MNRIRLALASVGICALAACAGPPVDRPAPLPLPPAAWSAADRVSGEEPRLDWWKELGDPELDRFVELALQNNADLRAASANLDAARELVREARAAKLPTGSVDASITRSRTAGAALQLDTVGGPKVLPSQTLVDAGASLSWELDLFGRLAAASKEANAHGEQQAWLRRGVEASVVASVVRAWADLAESDRRLALLDDRNGVLSDVATRLARAQEIGGVRRDRSIEAQIARGEIEAERPALETARRNALRRLATLTGLPAPEGVRALANLSPGKLPVPQFIRAGHPERILRLRPDVAAAEQELVQALARVDIARADLYPRISLFGSAGVNSVPGRLTDEGALRFGVGPMLSWGIFDMDRIRARIRAEGARAVAAGARWEASFMKSLEETDAALDAFAAASRTNAIAQDGVARAAQLSALTHRRWQGGQDSYLEAAAARDAQLRAAGEALRADSAVLATWIDAQIALGAGWRS